MAVIETPAKPPTTGERPTIETLRAVWEALHKSLATETEPTEPSKP
jgi:hypothetical protein